MPKEEPLPTIRAWKHKENREDLRDISESDIKKSEWFEEQHREKK